MKHLVITLSIYSPEVEREWNENRVRMVESNSAPSMAAQTTRDFEWMVCLHPHDPFLERRIAAFSAGAECRFVYFDPESPQRNDPVDGRVNHRASDALIENWRQASWRVDRMILPMIQELDRPLLMTRFDDDDAFAIDAFERIQAAAKPEPEPVVLMQPEGYIVWATPPIEVQPFRHPANGFSSILAPAGSHVHPYTYGHNRVVDRLPVRVVDDDVAWLMFRHEDNMSVFRRNHARKAANNGPVMGTGGAADNVLTFAKPYSLAKAPPGFREMFPLNWDRQW